MRAHSRGQPRATASKGKPGETARYHPDQPQAGGTPASCAGRARQRACEGRAATAGWRVPAELTVPRLNLPFHRLNFVPGVRWNPPHQHRWGTLRSLDDTLRSPPLMSMWNSGWVSMSSSCTCVLATPMNSIGMGFAHTALCSQHGVGPAAADDKPDRAGNKGVQLLGPAAWMAQIRPAGTVSAAPWVSSFSSQTLAFAQGQASTRQATI